MNYFLSTFGRFMPTGFKGIVKDIKDKKIGKPGQNYQGEH